MRPRPGYKAMVSRTRRAARSAYIESSFAPFGREAIGGIAVKSNVRRALRMGIASPGSGPLDRLV